MSQHSIIFCGTPEFACPCLQALHDDPTFDVTAVITQPDKPAGRKKVLSVPAVKTLAEKLGIPILQPENINTAVLPENAPDFLVTASYGQKLSSEVLQYPNIAALNIHPSLLPHLRGPSPVPNSILMGEKETGVTIQRMAEEIDSGPILAQETVTIEPRETKDRLLERLFIIGSELLIHTINQPLHETPQDESKATYCKKLTRSVGHVDPKEMTAEEIDRHVRALVPWPGVRTTIKDEEVKLIETALEESTDAFAVECKDDTTLCILKIQSPGKSIVTGAEWGRGKS